MTSAAEPAAQGTIDWRIVVSGGAKIGGLTAVGVVAFAMLSRGLTGTPEFLVQSILILVGGAVFAYLPSAYHRPTEVDSIAWAAMIGLMGALFFTVIDTAVLRPIDLYHWTWDAIGGGSGFWYIPVWWMGAAVLAWLGAWAVANAGPDATIPVLGVQTAGIGIVVAAILIGIGILPMVSAVVALGFSLGVILQIPIAAVLRRG